MYPAAWGVLDDQDSRSGQYVVSDDNIKRRPPWWMLVIVGGFAGGVCGFLVGGATTLAFVVASVAFEGANPPIIVVPIYAIFSAFLYTLAGAFVGAIWPVLRRQTRRLTIARLMGLIALVGLSLTPFLAARWLGVLILTNTLIVLPVVIAALVAADRIAARHSTHAKSTHDRGLQASNLPAESFVLFRAGDRASSRFSDFFVSFVTFCSKPLSPRPHHVSKRSVSFGK